MGPLIPFIFSSEFGMVIAFIIGIAFGFILEQAGFSSTKKLVGLFYGYDFTVLRVFFTAGITAMVGVMLLGHFGLLDISIIYVNPTFLRSALIGGFIMGGGFIIGGFCPGTSVCAAAIGKIDAMFFIFGSFLGIWVFTENYVSLEKFYTADNMGAITAFDILNIPKNFFAFIMIVVALGAFYFTWRIENNVNKRPHTINPVLRKKYIMGFSWLFIGLAVIFIIPDHDERLENKITRAKEQKKCVFKEIEADKLAYEISNNYYKLNIIDVRGPEEFEKFHLPMAINIPFDEIMDREWEALFKQNIKTNIFYADNDTLVRMSCLKAKHIGNSSNLILKESSQEFRHMFYELEEPTASAPKEDHQLFHFRSQTAQKMDDLVESLQNIGKPVKKEIKTVKGGCS